MASEAGTAAERRRCRSNLLEFCRELARWSGRTGEVVERDGVLVWASSTSFPVTLNGVARLDPTVAPADVLALADAAFARRGHGYTVNVEAGIDDDLAEAAARAGLTELGSSPQMVCRNPVRVPERPDGVTTRWAADVADVRAFVEVADTAYQSLGMPTGAIREAVTDPARVLAPHLATVLAEEGGRAVAAAQVLLSHGMAGVYYVGTIPEVRGRGLAELVTALVTNRGFEQGAAIVGLQATAMGEPLYRRMGYEEVARQSSWVRFEAPGTSPPSAGGR